MAWVMSVLGALLALGGAVSLWNGSSYIRMDWGQAETVAGTVALSAGVVALGIAAMLFRLRDLARPAPLAAVPATPLPAVEGPQGPATVRVAGGPATAALPKPERVEPAPVLPPRTADLDEPFAASHSLHDPLPAAPEPAWDEPRPRAAPPEAPRPAPVLAEAPTVVGRYEANGASYVLFSDGTIEVETENGTHRFDSMAHLKHHIERQEAG